MGPKNPKEAAQAAIDTLQPHAGTPHVDAVLETLRTITATPEGGENSGVIVDETLIEKSLAQIDATRTALRKAERDGTPGAGELLDRLAKAERALQGEHVRAHSTGFAKSEAAREARVKAADPELTAGSAKLPVR